MIDEDLDETARLVLMEHPRATFIDFTRSVREVRQAGLVELRESFARYRGWDGREQPTHDLSTGLPFERWVKR